MQASQSYRTLTSTQSDHQQWKFILTPVQNSKLFCRTWFVPIINAIIIIFVTEIRRYRLNKLLTVSVRLQNSSALITNGSNYVNYIFQLDAPNFLLKKFCIISQPADFQLTCKYFAGHSFFRIFSLQPRIIFQLTCLCSTIMHHCPS